MFRIGKAGNGNVVFTVSGRIEADDLTEIQQQLARETGTENVVLDLREVTLVNESWLSEGSMPMGRTMTANLLQKKQRRNA